MSQDSGNRNSRHLRDLRGIGPAILDALHQLGITSVEELSTRDGDDLYMRFCDIKWARVDPCCLDVFNCAIAQARDPDLPAELREWWTWSRIRKSEVDQGNRRTREPR